MSKRKSAKDKGKNECLQHIGLSNAALLNVAAPMVKTRKMPERWWIRVCPGCNGIVGEMSQTHLGDCDHRGKIFAARTVEVIPAATSDPERRSLDDDPWRRYDNPQR